jgi:hypothetical protein
LNAPGELREQLEPLTTGQGGQGRRREGPHLGHDQPESRLGEVPVHCYGVEEVSKSQAWIWLEAREDAGPHALWTIEHLALAAYDFGALAAQWQSKLHDVGQYRWLAQRWLRGWVAIVRILQLIIFLSMMAAGWLRGRIVPQRDHTASHS